MSKYQIDSTTLTGIGDAIRTKGGTSALINPEDMPAAIAALPEPEPKWAPLNNGKTNCWFKIPEGGRLINLRLQVDSANNNVLVDWGDETSDTYTLTSTSAITVSHFQATGGTYIVGISGEHFKLPTSFISIKTNNEYMLMPYIEIAHQTANTPFDSNYGIQKVAIMKGCTTLGDEAFENATNLDYIYFEERETPLSFGGNYVFGGCTSLKEAIIPKGTINASGFPNHFFSGCTNLSYIELPSDLTSFEGGDHFSNCRSLTSLTIPSTVTSLHSSSVLVSNSSLEKIYLNPTTPPTVGGAVTLPQEYSMYIVPTASLTAYKTDAKFSTVADRIYPTGYSLYSTFNTAPSSGTMIYSYTATENCTFDIGEQARGFTNTSSSEGYISITVNGTEQYNHSLGVKTYDLLDNFTPIALTIGDTVSILCGWTGSHTGCYFYLFANPTIS